MGTASRVLKFAIGSDFGSAQNVQSTILDEVKRRKFNDTAIFAIRVALHEALTNAIKHGNQMEETKKVAVSAKFGPQRVEIVVEDEGGGFDPNAVPDPTLDCNILRPSGRGIHMIETYMHEVEWSRGGRRLKMVRRNTPDED
jgi:serine/threonine-protein kinase RsbW